MAKCESSIKNYGDKMCTNEVFGRTLEGVLAKWGNDGRGALWEWKGSLDFAGYAHLLAVHGRFVEHG